MRTTPATAAKGFTEKFVWSAHLMTTFICLMMSVRIRWGHCTSDDCSRLAVLNFEGVQEVQWTEPSSSSGTLKRKSKIDIFCWFFSCYFFLYLSIHCISLNNS
jgi:hypothetical protein